MKCQVIKSKDPGRQEITFYYKEMQSEEALSSEEEEAPSQNNRVNEQIKEIFSQIQQ